MPPTVIRMTSPMNNNNIINSGNGGGGGINICCCRICTCIQLNFLLSKHGLIKICEVILGSFCQTLLIRFGLTAAGDIGQAFNSFLTTASACLTTTAILLACYLVSSKTFHLVRQSLFEVVFNIVSCFLYLSAASYMAFAVNIFLYPRFVMQTAYMAYPAMTAVYYIGIVVGVIHGLDAYMAYQYFKGYR